MKAKFILSILSCLLLQTACYKQSKQTDNPQISQYLISEDNLAQEQKKLDWYQRGVQNINVFLEDVIYNQDNYAKLTSLEALKSAKQELSAGLSVGENILSESIENQAKTLLSQISGILTLINPQKDRINSSSLQKISDKISLLNTQVSFFKSQIESNKKRHQQESRELLISSGNTLKITALDTIQQANNILQIFTSEADLKNPELIQQADEWFNKLTLSIQSLKSSYQKLDKEQAKKTDYGLIITSLGEFTQNYVTMKKGDVEAYNNMLSALHQLPKNLHL